MKITNDDSLRRVDSRWLGVPGWTFPWNPTRYNAYGIGIPVFVVLMWLVTRFVDTGFWPITYVLVATIYLTSRIMDSVDEERPAASAFAMLWAELGAPRTSRHHDVTQSSTWNLAAVPIFSAPDDTGQVELLHRPTQPERPKRSQNRH